MRFVKSIAISICLIVMALTFVRAQDESTPSAAPQSDSELLVLAYDIRSSKPKEAERILAQLERTYLKRAEKDVYDYLSAYLVFMNGKVQESIAQFEVLAKDGYTPKGRFDAHTSLGTLYAAIQDWSSGLRIMTYLTKHVTEIDDITSEEQAHIAFVNFYNLLGESAAVKSYIENLPKRDFGERFYCIMDMQHLSLSIELEIDSVTEDAISEVLSTCNDAGELLPVLYLHSQRATFYFEKGHFDDALDLLLEHKPAIQSLNYEPLLDVMNQLLAELYFEKGLYDDAVHHANAVVTNTSSNNLISDADIAAFDVLYKIAEARKDYQSALQYYKKFAEASSLNITQENAKELSVQKAKQDSTEKSNQIALLDAENSLLRTQADLDAQTARNRLFIIAIFIFLVLLLGIWMYKRQSYYELLRKTSQRDDLTGISNRRYFFQEARTTIEFCKFNEKSVSLILIDLDNFKSINDTFGHMAGDNALKVATSVIKEICREDDLFGRLGGEEFGILLKGCDIKKAIEIAEICRDRLERTNRQKHQAFALTGSFGVVDSNIAGHNFEALFEAADKALYDAKNGGKNAVIKAA